MSGADPESRKFCPGSEGGGGGGGGGKKFRFLLFFTALVIIFYRGYQYINQTTISPPAKCHFNCVSLIG